MSAVTEVSPRPEHMFRPKLDGASPLAAAVVRHTTVLPRQNVVRQGDIPSVVHLVLEGMAFRHRLLTDGYRQITAILVPGDLCDIGPVLCGRADYGVVALTACVLGEIPKDRVDDIDAIDPEVRRAVWRQMLRDEAIAREWMVGLGRRSAKARIAHLLCELQERLRSVGLGGSDGYALALTQSELADVLGLSAVHVNRILQDLRQDGLIDLKNRVLHIIDHAALVDVAGYDPTYLAAL